VTNLWNGFPQDFFVGLLVDFSGVVSRFQHKLHFLHNALLSLDFLEELLLDSHLDGRAGHVVDDLQLVVDNLRLHLLRRGSILSLRNSCRFPLVLGFPRSALTAYDTLPGS